MNHVNRAQALLLTGAAFAGGPALAELAHAETRPGVVATEVLDGVYARTGASFAFPGNPNALASERIQFDDCYQGEPPIWKLGSVSTQGSVNVSRTQPVKECIDYVDQDVTNVVMVRTSRANGSMGPWRSTKVSLSDTPNDTPKSGMRGSFKWTPDSRALPRGRKGEAYIKSVVRNVNETARVPDVEVGHVGPQRTVKTATKKAHR